jgi:hypothetical protein
MTENTKPTNLFVVVGGTGTYGAWGSGDTKALALAEFRRQRGSVRLGYTLIEFTEDTKFEGMDQMGRVHWNGPEPTMTVIEGTRKTTTPTAAKRTVTKEKR